MRTGTLSCVLTIAALFLGACATAPVSPTAAEKQALAPTGKLRAAVFAGQPVHSVRDPATGEYRGIAVDLGNEMAQRLGVPFELVPYRTVPEFVASVQSGQWDIAFSGIVADRRKDLEFGPPYARVELGYLVGSASSLRSAGEVDRAGVRVAVLEKGVSDVVLTRTLKHATLLRTSAMNDSVEAVRNGKADAMAAAKTFLFPASDRVPGSRIVDGMFDAEEITIAVKKGNQAGAEFVRRFLEEAKAKGVVRQAMDKARIRGLSEAP